MNSQLGGCLACSRFSLNMLFSESHDPDINLEALYLDFFFFIYTNENSCELDINTGGQENWAEGSFSFCWKQPCN